MPSSFDQDGAASQPAEVARGLPIWTPQRSVPQAAPTLCSTCRVRNLCLPGTAQADDTIPFDALVLTRRRVRSGDCLFRAGDPFHALYAVRAGFFKSCAVTSGGRSQITAFPMVGDLAGIDGIGSGTHVQDLVAIETGEVCVLPYAHLQKQIGLNPALQHRVNRIMSREIVREQHLMSLLGNLDGEARVAEFLLSLAERFAARGYSSTEFNLPMSRAEIGSYLGLALATVSRTVSKLHRLGLIEKRGREVGIADQLRLRAIAGRKQKPGTREGGTLASAPACRPLRPWAGNLVSFRLQGQLPPKGHE